jgi:hypothetical protein
LLLPDCRLVFVARGGAWSPATHRRWPDGFQAAARDVLLAGGRTGGSGRGAHHAPAAGLAALPAEMLLRIVQLAAAPMSAWF